MQSIMDIYGQESQRSMAQFLPEELLDFYRGIVSVDRVILSEAKTLKKSYKEGWET